MKHSVLFFIFLSFIPGSIQCHWISPFSSIGRILRSYAMAPLREKFKTTFKNPAPSNQFSRRTNNYPYFTAASMVFGLSTCKAASCEEKAIEGNWVNLEEPNKFIGVYTPLSLAAKLGDYKNLKKLLDAGADPNVPVPLGSALHMAARYGHVKMVQELVACGADVWQEDATGALPIEEAIKANHTAIYELLLDIMSNDKGSEKETRCKIFTKTLHVAAQGGNLKMVQELVACGADVWLENNCGILPIHKAVEGGQLDMLIYLLTLDNAQKAMVNMPSSCGKRPLDYAIAGRYKHAINLLLSCGAVLESAMLEKAITVGNDFDIFKLFFTHSRNNGVTIDRGNLLILASRKGRLDVVQYLCAHGADVDGGTSKTSPLIEAANCGHAKVVAFLCSQGANLDKKDTGVVGELSALHKAALNRHTEVVKLLLDAGADPFVEDFLGSTPSSSNYTISWLLFLKRLHTSIRWLTG